MKKKTFEKSFAMPKKTERGTLWSYPVLYVTQEDFLVQFLGQRVQFGGFLKFCGRTILVTSGVSKKN